MIESCNLTYFAADFYLSSLKLTAEWTDFLSVQAKFSFN